jgi:spermidine/putrescine transport system ATP-binding protein
MAQPDFETQSGPGKGASENGSVVLDGISKSYPGTTEPALRTTSLTIAQGEFFSILGPSGSGKTTTLRLIAGFERPDTGRIMLAGQDVTGLPPDKRDVNTVFQNYALFPHLTVAENIAYPLVMRKVEKGHIGKRVAEALDLVEMQGFEARLPHQLSGGQRQRIALARSLIGHPKVLLLDEPLGALDLRLRQHMQHVLTSLQERLGITFVYVTHDQGEALSMSNRVAIMNRGRIEQVGSPEDLYYAPVNSFVAGFVGKSNLIDVGISEDGGGRHCEAAGIRFALPQATGTGRAKLAIRGECLKVSKQQDGLPPVTFPATVKDVLFVGTSLEVRLDRGGVEFIALVPAQRERPIASGDAVHCGFDPAEVRVLYE